MHDEAENYILGFKRGYADAILGVKSYIASSSNLDCYSAGYREGQFKYCKEKEEKRRIKNV